MTAPLLHSQPPSSDKRGRIVGLTGGIASGKSLVSSFFAELGIPVIDTDTISRELVTPGGECLEAIRQRFGEAIIGADGQLDRTALRQRILESPEERAALEAILHPAIRAEARRQALEAAGRAPYVLVVVPLLAEPAVWPAYQDWLDAVVTLTARLADRRARLATRPGLDDRQADALIAAQVDDDARRAISDHELDNSGTPDELRRQVQVLDRRLRQTD
ncbi:dephospho-CoA kinase [Guyparkeria hydrothermalis]|uniref:dephospho-CoA kinase n=1 Tax=Guyparkeria hydrothermalis TaxID=923 RepID=UPI002020EFBF|nr:dephospho-CoA kinase [Guyparkeria hydrothermalis]MCL7745234.1 dephospho-CoA kinase [Guyparkeria hydrothermalis]